MVLVWPAVQGRESVPDLSVLVGRIIEPLGCGGKFVDLDHRAQNLSDPIVR